VAGAAEDQVTLYRGVCQQRSAHPKATTTVGLRRPQQMSSGTAMALLHSREARHKQQQLHDAALDASLCAACPVYPALGGGRQGGGGGGYGRPECGAIYPEGKVQSAVQDGSFSMHTKRSADEALRGLVTRSKSMMRSESLSSVRA
jgi:hypothetical protein